MVGGESFVGLWAGFVETELHPCRYPRLECTVTNAPFFFSTVFDTELVSIDGVAAEPKVLVQDAAADKSAEEAVKKVNDAVNDGAKEEMQQKIEEEAKKTEEEKKKTEAAKAEAPEPSAAQNPQGDAGQETKAEETGKGKDEL